MRYSVLYKNLIWIYLCILCCFAYGTMMDSIPGHVYLQEGQTLQLDQKLPVMLAADQSRREVMVDVGESTYQTIQRRRECVTGEKLEAGNYKVTCYLFGLFPIKEVEVSVVGDKSLYASGHVVGIYGATNGVFVLDTSPVETMDGVFEEPADHILFAGDYIMEVNGTSISTKEELVSQIAKNGQSPMVLTLIRGQEQIKVSVQAVPVQEEHGCTYKLGVWVKDDMAGIGTLTYYNDSGSFGALGHGIGDGETGNLLRIGEGELYESEILTIVKGERGTPGELQGVVRYGQKNQIGTVTSNTDIGIYGDLDKERLEEYSKEDTYYSVGYKQDVKPQDAVILSDASGEPGVYHIVIDSLDYSPSDKNKGIRFHVDDEALLDLTGGIVQGLSGSPIIQNGQIIGAVTHVLVNDPTRGYGIFVENMLEH